MAATSGKHSNWGDLGGAGGLLESTATPGLWCSRAVKICHLKVCGYCQGSCWDCALCGQVVLRVL